MKVGEQATSVFADAQEMLGVILKERNWPLKEFMEFSMNQVNDDDIVQVPRKELARWKKEQT
jgi:5-methyltetrahydrofolate--homocysteine methyltransferase